MPYSTRLHSDFEGSRRVVRELYTKNGPPNINGSISQASGSDNRWCTCGHVCGQDEKSTSKFIQRVISERDSYKRELTAERLKCEEVIKTLDYAKEKMDKTISEHELEMDDAIINKELLKRKEGQLEDIKAKIEGAMEQEKFWKSEIDTVKAESRQKVMAAEDYAAMKEAQISTISRHWQDKQADLDKQEAKAKKLITDALNLLQPEAGKTKRLEEICDEYRAENKRLSVLAQAAFDTHKEYKICTENLLSTEIQKERQNA
jgi:chromosome segregation ATPase